MVKAIRLICGIPLAAIGIGTAVATVTEILDPYKQGEASFTAVFSALCLLGAFFVLRRA